MKVSKIFAKFLLMIMVVFSCLSVRAEAPESGTYYGNSTDYVQKIYNSNIVDRHGNQIGHIAAYIKKLRVNNEDKGYIYCIEPNKDNPESNEALTREELDDAGYMYLMRNGFPAKKPYDGTDKENYYVTQIAVWMYAYVVHGLKDGNKIAGTLIDSNGNQLDNYGKTSETEAIVEAAYKLYKGAKEAYDSDEAPATSVGLTLSATNNDLTLNGQYLMSPEVTVNLTGADTYKVTVVGGGYAADTNNNKKSTFNAGEKFKLISNGPKDTKLKAIVTASISIDKIYKYTPSGTSHQSLVYAYIDGTPKTVQKEISFTFQANRIPISKQDATTGQELPGATLVLKDQNGNVVELTEDNINKTNPWVSSTTPYELVLNPGQYVLEEMIQPKGYALQKQTVEFTVNADGTVAHPVVMTNEPLKGVDISKYEATGEEELPGATLEVHDKEGNLVDSWVSSTITHHVVLEPGSYTLTESIAPEGYLKSESVIEFTVLEDGSVATPVFMRNELIPVPITGSNRSLIVAIASFALIVTGTVMLLLSLKNRKKEEV